MNDKNSFCWQDYLAVRQSYPDMHTQGLAKEAGVSEAEVMQAAIGHGVQRLITNPMKLLSGLVHLGNLLAVTNNSSAALETMGSYKNPRIDDVAGMFLNPRELDLRVFPKRWVSIFATDENFSHGEKACSLQFYDEAGNSVHRVYATNETDMQQWQQLINRYVNNDAPALQLTQLPASIPGEQPATSQTVEQYWRDMVDVHQFHGLLKTFGLTRQQAFGLISDALARKVSCDSVSKLLQQVQHAGNEIMIFTGSTGCVQIYSGTVTDFNPRQYGDCLTLKGHNMRSYQLNTRDVDECWVVKKPAGEDFVTSLEFFDAKGMQISQFYGWRQEGAAEQICWRQQVNALE